MKSDAAMRTMRYRILAAAVSLALLASLASGAQLAAKLSGPVLGFVFERNTGKVRPLRGIAGNATIGLPVELAFHISQVLTLNDRHLIASTDSSPDALILDLGSTPPSSNSIPGIAANATHAVASLQGTAAAFYYADRAQVLIVTGLPEQPVVSRHYGLSRLARPLTHMAVSDDGELLVYGVEESGSEGALYRWSSSSQDPQLLTSVVSIGGLAITADNTAIVADKGANEVFALRDVARTGGRQHLAGISEGVSEPAAVAVSSANRIYVANTGTSTVMVFDSQGRVVRSQVCDCRLSGVHRLRDSVFRLTDRTDQTIFLLDATTNQERIVFVPPPRD